MRLRELRGMHMEIPDTDTRVLEKGPEGQNLYIHRQMESRVFYYAGHPDEIDGRLAELNSEWDIERMLQANAAGFSLFGVLMGVRDRKWLVLPMAVAGFLMQHALQGWCPPAEVFRRLGVRTTKEINDERYALRVLRGDFNELNIASVEDPMEKARKAIEAAS